MIVSPEETLERRELDALKLRRLKAQLLRVGEALPVLRARWEAAGAPWRNLRSLDELAAFPFMTKADLRDHYPTGLFGRPLQEVARVHASSGTRGKPTVVGYSRADLELWALVVARCLAMAGAEPGQVLHNAYGYGLFTGGLGLHQGAERLGLTVVPMSGGQTARQLLFLEDLAPHGIACTPSYLLNMAETYRETRGRAPRGLGLRWAILGAEPWSEGTRQQLEEAFGIDAVDIYGLSEVIGPGVAAECREAKDGLHVNEDHFHVEVVDPVSGAPLPPGETGELVFTTLTRQVSPVVRYRTGDVAALNPEPCVCGRRTVRMSRVKGRTDDMLVVRGVNVFPSEIEGTLAELPELLPVYRVVLRRPRALDEVVVEVESAEPSEALRARVEARLRERLGISVTVAVRPPHTLPRSEGKAVRVVDERGAAGPQPARGGGRPAW